jgi:signal recognition particle receptor subunit beta
MAESEADLENGDVVANYTRPRRPYKVAFTGIYGVGKTSLFRKILNEPPTFRANGTREEIFHKDKTVIPV